MIEKFEIIGTDPVYVRVTEISGKTWGQIIPDEHAVSMDAVQDFLESRYQEMNAPIKVKADFTSEKDKPINSRPDKDYKWDDQLKDWKHSGVIQ